MHHGTMALLYVVVSTDFNSVSYDSVSYTLMCPITVLINLPKFLISKVLYI